MRHDRRRVALGLLCGAATPRAVLAQPAPPASEAARGDDELRSDLVKTGLYAIAGGGCNSLLRLSAAGCVLVDGKRAGTYRALMSQVRRINKLSDLPLRAVVFTNHREEHAGNRTRFIDAGVAVLAQARALPRLDLIASAPAEAASAARERKGPVFGFDAVHAFRMGGVEIRLHHFGAACTDNDSVVQFPDMRVVAIGDLWAAAGPVPDVAAGGTLPGWRAALARLLALDFDVAVPTAGPAIERATLAAYERRLDALLTSAASSVKSGVPAARLRERMEPADREWTMRWDDAVVRGLHAELAQAR